MTLGLRWTEQAVNQLSAIAEYVSLSSPVVATAFRPMKTRDLHAPRARLPARS